MPGDSVSFGLAFMAGMLSFVSPCVLPLFPSYISYLTGLSYEEIKDGGETRGVRQLILINSLFFILGFSAVFVALGASISYLGNLLFSYQDGIRIGGGIFITMFGLYIGDRALDFRLQLALKKLPPALAAAVAVVLLLAGLLGILKESPTLGGVLMALGLYAAAAVFFPALSQEKRITLNSKPAGWAGSFVVGVTFAAGWTPCVGPILGSILLYAGTKETTGQGITLLAAYSAGLGVPFLLSGLGVSYFFNFYQSFKKYFRAVELGSSVMLLAVGILIISNYLSVLSAYLIFWTGYTGV
ncbi:MAG: cytochrome c biogenesis protein CcdA [Nitrospinaceae bacterium]|jgi:cytochrome c-type biogenesis protein|nr:cytochrome c biogenesis protein CcdA [Nitrospinaceae bacterium]MBT5368912.1 cytochrome c biogenesis protein CcdA [Nitrospinaceae bacterium]MBT5947893.1 cytochrome c biogenesis protein CcdA [Nitrospinaceae bacterium]MBT6395949.1 cytochrome c biogenesis protein CcdA [Nitrospinaceae bacterium]MBT7858211.1 cytochrome c biogenesis protein CcdA [Nitrospinaceae bacterium]